VQESTRVAFELPTRNSSKGPIDPAGRWRDRNWRASALAFRPRGQHNASIGTGTGHGRYCTDFEV